MSALQAQVSWIWIDLPAGASFCGLPGNSKRESKSQPTDLTSLVEMNMLGFLTGPFLLRGLAVSCEVPGALLTSPHFGTNNIMANRRQRRPMEKVQVQATPETQHKGFKQPHDTFGWKYRHRSLSLSLSPSSSLSGWGRPLF